MQVLLACDDAMALRALKERGLQVVRAPVEDVSAYLADYNFSALLLDFRNLALLKELRNKGISTPVLILSDAQMDAAELASFAAGADDYLQQPFNGEVLFARICAVVRRANGHSTAVLQTGQLVLDQQKRTATLCGKHLRLTVKEFEVLEVLMLRKSLLVTRQAIFTSVWGVDTDVDIKAVDVRMYRIRRKIEELSPQHEYIHTSWGNGYVLEERPSKLTQTASSE